MIRSVASILLACIALQSHGGLLVRETFDAVTGGTLNGAGDTTSSLGFEPFTLWMANPNSANALSLMLANNFNVDTGVTNAKPWQISAGNDNRGGIWWNAGSWDTSSWAVRPLAEASRVNLAADGVYYIAFNITYRSDDSLGFGFATGDTDTSQFISVGPNWNNTGFNGNASAKRLAVAYGTLNVGQGVSGANAWSDTRVTNNLNYVILAKITARAAANDTIQAAFFHTGRPGYGILPTDEAQITWDITHDFADNNMYTHLLAFINGGSYYANLDSFRMGTAYRDIAQIEPLILTQPVPSPAGTVYAGVSVSLAATAGGGLPEPLNYQWFKGGTAVEGGTSASLTLTNPAVADSGDYYLRVTNPYGVAYSVTNTITVLPANPPLIATDIQPVAPERFVGGHVTFSVGLDGTPPFRMQWKHAGNNIDGATNLTLTLTDLDAADAGAYQLFVTNDFGWNSSSAGTLTLRTPEPGSYEALVVAERPISYWRLNENAAPGVAELASDYMGGNDLYHTNVYATAGPASPAFPGLESTNQGAAYDGASTASASQAPVMNNLAQFTLMGWWSPSYWPQQTGTGSSRVALFGQNNCAEFGFHGANTIGIWTPGGGYVSFDGTTLITPGNWYFITAVGNGTNVTFYLNGNVAASGGNATTNYGSSSYPFRVGYGVLDSSGNEFTGTIDEVAVFDRALTEQQINTIYSKAAGVVAPALLTQPAADVRYVNQTKTFQVTASGTLPLAYQWRKDGQDLADTAKLTGAKSNVLTIATLQASDAGQYEVEVSNTAGAVTSAPVQLDIIVPVPGSYEAKMVALDPVGYWRLNEPDEVEVAHDYWGHRHGTYNTALLSAAGPQSPAWPGFETTNSGYNFVSGVADGYVTLPAVPINTNTVTLTCWIYPEGDQGGFRGLVFSRHSPPVAGLHFGNGNELRYTWDDQNWGWNSGLVVPTNEWVFAALVVEPNKATIYMGANGQLTASVNNVSHVNQNFGAGTTLVGVDAQDTTGRIFNGRIDEIAMFGRALAPAEVQALYETGSGAVRIQAHRSGNQVILSWPSGVLQQADTVNGTYSDVTGATSPYPVDPVGTKYFRVKVK